VTVTDSAGTVVTSPVYMLTVFAAGSLAVGSTQLPTAFLGRTYTATMHYAGGTPPYNWTLISINREPGYPGDPGEDLQANIAAIGLGFYPGQGQIEGSPTQVGVFALQVQVTDGETPPATATGLVLLTVTSTTSFSFETVLLPPATVNQYYSTTLQTNAPTSEVPNLFFQVINSSEKATDTAKEALPPGLTLYSNGNIQDVPLLAGNYSFLVEATDGQGGVAIQSFSLQVTSAKATSSGGGCQSAPGAPALAGLILLALTQVRRRSSRRRLDS
jgi:large repetitive protein